MKIHDGPDVHCVSPDVSHDDPDVHDGPHNGPDTHHGLMFSWPLQHPPSTLSDCVSSTMSGQTHSF